MELADYSLYFQKIKIDFFAKNGEIGQTLLHSN